MVICGVGSSTQDGRFCISGAGLSCAIVFTFLCIVFMVTRILVSGVLFFPRYVDDLSRYYTGELLFCVLV